MVIEQDVTRTYTAGQTKIWDALQYSSWIIMVIEQDVTRTYTAGQTKIWDALQYSSWIIMVIEQDVTRTYTAGQTKIWDALQYSSWIIMVIEQDVTRTYTAGQTKIWDALQYSSWIIMVIEQDVTRTYTAGQTKIWYCKASQILVWPAVYVLVTSCSITMMIQLLYCKASQILVWPAVYVLVTSCSITMMIQLLYCKASQIFAWPAVYVLVTSSVYSHHDSQLLHCNHSCLWIDKRGLGGGVGWGGGRIYWVVCDKWLIDFLSGLGMFSVWNGFKWNENGFVSVHFLAGEVHPGDGEHWGTCGSAVAHHRDHAGLPGAEQFQRSAGGGQRPQLGPSLPAGSHLQGRENKTKTVWTSLQLGLASGFSSPRLPLVPTPPAEGQEQNIASCLSCVYVKSRSWRSDGVLTFLAGHMPQPLHPFCDELLVYILYFGGTTYLK